MCMCMAFVFLYCPFFFSACNVCMAFVLYPFALEMYMNVHVYGFCFFIFFLSFLL